MIYYALSGIAVAFAVGYAYGESRGWKQGYTAGCNLTQQMQNVVYLNERRKNAGINS